MLNTRRGLLLVIAAMVVGMAAGKTSAADAPKSTVMTVGEMCSGCVKKITARLEKMPGVAKIECDIAKKTVTVTPALGKDVTALALWDAMSEIGKTPKKMASPSGTFAAEPEEVSPDTRCSGEISELPGVRLEGLLAPRRLQRTSTGSV